MRRQPNCALILPHAWPTKSGLIPRTCACAASSCFCSGPPSARWMPSACISCSSISRRWMCRPTSRPPRRQTWPASSRRRWRMCWRKPTKTRTSGPLPTCTTVAAPTRRRATPCWNSTISAVRCPIPCRHCSPLRNSGKTANRRRIRPGVRIFCALPGTVPGARRHCWKRAPARRPGMRRPMLPTQRCCRTMWPGWNGFARNCSRPTGTRRWRPWKNWAAAGARRGASRAAKIPTPQLLRPVSCGTAPKSRLQLCAPTFCFARQRSMRRTAAARPPWWRRWCVSPGPSPMPALRPNARKNCWTTPTLNI